MRGFMVSPRRSGATCTVRKKKLPQTSTEAPRPAFRAQRADVRGSGRRSLMRGLAILLIPLALAACGGHGDDEFLYSGFPPPGTYANFQVVNGSPDAPPIALQID